MDKENGIYLDGVTVDQVLRRIGGYRKWHLMTFTLLSCTTFVVIAFHTLAILFIGWTPDFHCAVPDNGSVVWGDLRPSKCHMYTNSSIDNTTTACTAGWKYDEHSYHTISSQWDLVCDKALWTDTSQVIYKAGNALGEVFGAFLMDRFGRKPMHIVGLFGVAVIGTAVAFAPNFLVFSIFRFFLGCCISISSAAGLVLLIEIFDAQKRDFAAIVSEAFWVMGYMLAGFAGYLCLDWRIYQAIASSIALIGVVYIWVLVESPLWIAANNKYEEAEKVLERIARWNDIKVRKIRLKRMPSEPEQATLVEEKALTSHDDVIHHVTSTTEVKVIDLFKDGVLRTHFLVSVLLWFTSFLVYFFLILSSPSFAGGRFLNFFLGGLVEIPAYIFAFFVGKRLGRRLPTCVLHLIAAVALGGIIAIQFASLRAAVEIPLVMTFSLIGKMAISASFAIIIPYTKELFPTTIRGISGGLFVILGQIGGMSAPMLAFVMKTPMKWIPLLVCVVICLASGIFSLLLPETFNKPLPQTLQEVHDLYQPPRITSGENEGREHEIS